MRLPQLEPVGKVDIDMIEVRTHQPKEPQFPLATSISDSSTTDEGCRRLPDRLEIPNLLASVNEPQSCQTYLATQECPNADIDFL